MILSLRLKAIKPTSLRSFSTTSTPRAQETVRIPLDTPPYPYGPSNWYKKSNRGLYGGLRRQAGNNVSEKTETKTRRVWKPNVQAQEVYSKALRRSIRMKIVTRVLRTIKKVGGLDEYLLGEKAARIKELGPMGWKLRWAVMQTHSVRMRMGQEARQIGLSEDRRFERRWMSLKEMTRYLQASKGLSESKAGEEATKVENSSAQISLEAETSVAEEEAKTAESTDVVGPAGIEEAKIEDVKTEGTETEDIGPIDWEGTISDMVRDAARDANHARICIEYIKKSSEKQLETYLRVDKSKSAKEELIQKLITGIHHEQERAAIPNVKKVHKLGGKRGRRQQRHALTVRREKVIETENREEVIKEGKKTKSTSHKMSKIKGGKKTKSTSHKRSKDVSVGGDAFAKRELGLAEAVTKDVIQDPAATHQDEARTWHEKSKEVSVGGDAFAKREVGLAEAATKDVKQNPAATHQDEASTKVNIP